jgi:pimeloyl-ACP methyl ester carboxylesterase
MDLDIKGTRIHVVVSEEQGTEKEPSLLFIHGAAGNASIWDFQAEYFKGKHRVYRLELPGHGKSSSDGEDEISAYAQWVRLATKRLFPSGVFALIGHSMGGAIALELAAGFLKGLQALVLVGTGAKLGVTPIIFTMLRENPDDFFLTIDRTAFCEQTSAPTRDRFIAVARACPLATITKDFKACDRFNTCENLKNIKVPTLILCGEQDLLTPVKYSKYLHEGISNSSLVIMPKAGHMVMSEQPALLNRALEIFLTTTPSRENQKVAGWG